MVAAAQTLGGSMSLQQKLPIELLVTQWAQKLDPVLANPIMKGQAIKTILLDANVAKTIPTGLGRMQQGWFLIDNMANCNVWRTQEFNAQNLTLESSVDTTISIWVF